MDTINWIILLAVSFFSAIIGTMVGMAMVFVVPALLAMGVPIHSAVATGRFSMLGITLGNFSRFTKTGKIRKKYILVFAIAGAVGALAGASFLKGLDERVLKITIGIFMILISVLAVFDEWIKSRFQNKGKISKRHHFFSTIGGLIIGAYIGVIGGGGATVVILMLVLIYGLSYHDAVANQKAITMPMSLIATAVFIYQGMVEYRIGVPLLLVNAAGGWVGAGLIMKFKPIWLKIVIVPIVICLGIWLIFF